MALSTLVGQTPWSAAGFLRLMRRLLPAAEGRGGRRPRTREVTFCGGICPQQRLCPRGSALLFAAATLLCAQTPVPFICPMDPEIRSTRPGKCSKCGMTLQPGIREQVEYPLHLRVTPKQIPAGRELQLAFHITDPKTGAAVTKFELVHEKLFHLFLVGQDLEYFAHVHPEPRPDGTFLLRTTLPKPGTYRLLCDYYPAGGVPQLTPRTITT